MKNSKSMLEEESLSVVLATYPCVWSMADSALSGCVSLPAGGVLDPNNMGVWSSAGVPPG